MRKAALFGLLVLNLFTSCKDHKSFVVGRIKKASKLATVEFTIDKIVHGQKDKEILWFIKLNEAQFIARSTAHIKAGIDLEKLKAEDVKIEGTKIRLTLPPVQVINFSYPAEEFYYDSINSSDAFLNKTTIEDQEKFFQQAETAIRSSLKNMDIVSITQRKTSIMLDNLLQALGYTEIFIDFHTGELIPEVSP